MNDDGLAQRPGWRRSLVTVLTLAGVTVLSFFVMSLGVFGLTTGCTIETACASGEWTCSPCDGIRRAWYVWLVLQGSLLVGGAAWTLRRPNRQGAVIGAYILLSGLLLFGALVSAS